MSIDGLPTETVHLPFVAGLNNKAHGYALDPPGLATCKNVEFDEVGALRLRKPYATIGSSIYPSGTIADPRKLAVVGDELLLFTKDTLYSWSETLTKWVSKGTHLAVAVTESTRFGNPTDQVFADRAQLGGLVVMVWTEVLAAVVTSYLAAYDATTGATVLAPVSLGTAGRPRVLAVGTAILVTWIVSGGGLSAKAIDPAAPVFTGIAGGTVMTASIITSYDIVKDPNANQAVWAGIISGGTDYSLGKIEATLSLAGAVTKTRTCDGVIALDCAPTTYVRVLRSAGTVIKGDLVTLSSLADATMDTTVGVAPGAGAISRIAAAHRSTADGGFYRCYVYWTESESTTQDFSTYYNWINTNSAVGVESAFAWDASPASRAFDHNGSVYLWTVFASTNTVSATGTTAVEALGVRAQLQNTYLLRRDDGTLIAKATWLRAGGVNYYTGHLPGVALASGTTGYAWAGTERQIVAVGGDDRSAYAARAPRDIAFSFDSDSARRVVQLGRTAYVTGGMILQYDGEALVEAGFNQYPWRLSFSVTAAGSTIPAGTYSYKSTYRFDNARGETDRSTTAIGGSVTIVANDQVDISFNLLRSTRKSGDTRVPAIEIWRTVIAAPVGAPFYLVTSKNPATTGDNAYIANGTSALQGDVFTDAVLITKEQSPENGDTLPRMAPPGASIICASDTRLFLAGVPGEPYRVHYSLLRGENEVAAFHGALSFALPAVTGAITSLIVHDGTLYAFTASACYAVPGEGFDNVGGGSNYGPPRLVSSDVGALSHDTVASTPGGVVFFSRKGWYRLRGLDVEYIGAKVEDYNTDTWVAAQVVESQHQIRVLSSSRMLVFDYLVGEWSEWTQASGLDLAMWRTYPMLLDTAVKKEQSTFSAVDYYMEIVTGWIKPAGLQGFARLREILVLGEYKANHAQQIKVGFDYAGTYTDDSTTEFFVAADAALVSGNRTQLRHGPSRQRIQSFRVFVKIVPAASGVVVPLTYDAVTLVGLSFEAGMRKGPYPRIAAIYKQ